MCKSYYWTVAESRGIGDSLHISFDVPYILRYHVPIGGTAFGATHFNKRELPSPVVAHPRRGALAEEAHCVEAIAPRKEAGLQFPKHSAFGYPSDSRRDIVASLHNALRSLPRGGVVPKVNRMSV